MAKSQPNGPGFLRRTLNAVFDAWHEARDPRSAPARRWLREHGERYQAMVAGSMNRLMGGWNPPSTDADASILDDLPTARARARDAALNDPVVAAVRKALADHVVSHGLEPVCEVDADRLGISAQEAADWQGEVNSFFASAVPYADVTGKLDFYGIQRLIYLSVLDGGDCFVSYPMVLTPDAPAMTKMNLIEAERVDSPPGSLGNPRISGGVQYDQWGRPQGYYIQRSHPGARVPLPNGRNYEFWARTRAGRLNITQVYDQTRIGQSRGIPRLAPAIPLLDHVSNYVDEVLLAARLQNAISVFIERGGDHTLAPELLRDRTSYDGWSEMGIRAGSINFLRTGDKATLLSPTTPSAYFDPLIVRLLRIIGAATGIPYEVFSADPTEANFSSQRAQWNNFRKTVYCEQNVLIPALEAYWRHVVYEGWLDAKLGPIGLGVPLEDNPAEWMRVSWRRPAPGYLDPTKEVAAYREAVDAKFMSRAQVIAEGGGDWQDTFRQLAAEEAAMKELGIKSSAPVPAQPQNTNTQDAAADEANAPVAEGEEGEPSTQQKEAEQEATA